MKKNKALLLAGLISLASCKKDTNKNDDPKGGKYGIEINANYEITLGTQEKFRLQDHIRFVVNLSGTTATVSDIENTEASIQKIQEGQSGCASSVQVSGTGPINEEGIPQ